MVDYSSLSDEQLKEMYSKSSRPDYSKMSDEDLKAVYSKTGGSTKAPAPYTPGAAESGFRGALQVATGGFGDELTGLYAAGKTGGWSDYLPAPVQMTRGLYRYLQNNPEARKA